MREPCGPVRPLAQRVGLCCSGHDLSRKPPLLGQIGPGTGALLYRRLVQPPLLRRDVFALLARRTLGRLVGRGQPDQRAQLAAHLAEVEVGVEVLDQGEHVTLCAAAGIPPALALMIDDDDLALSAPVLQAVLRALRLIETEAAFFQNHCAANRRPQLIDFRIAGHSECPRGVPLPRGSHRPLQTEPISTGSSTERLTAAMWLPASRQRRSLRH